MVELSDYIVFSFNTCDGLHKIDVRPNYENPQEVASLSRTKSLARSFQNLIESGLETHQDGVSQTISVTKDAEIL